MPSQVHQLAPLTCNVCGQTNVLPRTDSYYNKYTQETIVEATWSCPRCGRKFSSGIVSREKVNNEKQ